MKVLADMHVAPPLRRWMTRLGLALVVAILLGYVPGQLFRRDPRAIALEHKLEEARTEERKLAAENALVYREVEALRTDVGAIEDHARADLGMVYPDEVVLRVHREGSSPPAPRAAGQGVTP